MRLYLYPSLLLATRSSFSLRLASAHCTASEIAATVGNSLPSVETRQISRSQSRCWNEEDSFAPLIYSRHHTTIRHLFAIRGTPGNRGREIGARRDVPRRAGPPFALPNRGCPTLRPPKAGRVGLLGSLRCEKAYFVLLWITLVKPSASPIPPNPLTQFSK